MTDELSLLQAFLRAFETWCVPVLALIGVGALWLFRRPYFLTCKIRQLVYDPTFGDSISVTHLLTSYFFRLSLHSFLVKGLLSEPREKWKQRILPRAM